MFSIGHVLLVLQSQLYNDDDIAWKQQHFGWCVEVCFVIHSLKPRAVPIVEGSFDELCNPECPRGDLLGINLPILLAIGRHERCYAVEKSRQTRGVYGLALAC